jgi:hypothetical protein
MNAAQRSGVIAFLLSMAAGIAAAGAGNRAGTGGAAELLIPVGTRDIAMGGATVSTSTGVEALFYNPAGVAKVPGSAAFYFSHMSYIADIGVDYGAAAVSFSEFGVIAINAKALAIGDIAVTTNENPDGTGTTFSPQFFNLGLSYARMLSERVSVGVTATFISERMGDVSASGFAFNAGVTYDNLAAIDGLSIGVVLKNIGPQMKFDGGGLLYTAAAEGQNRPPGYYKAEAAPFELPSTLEFGVGYRYALDAQNSLQFAGAFQNNNFADDEYRLGAEYAFQNTLFIRGGMTMSPEQATPEFIYGPTFGAGLKYQFGAMDLSVDYAFRSVDVFSNNHIFSLGIGL